MSNKIYGPPCINIIVSNYYLRMFFFVFMFFFYSATSEKEALSLAAPI